MAKTVKLKGKTKKERNFNSAKKGKKEKRKNQSSKKKVKFLKSAKRES